MAYTPPVAGTENWDVPLNAALAAIDSDVQDALSGNGARVATPQDTTSTSYTDLSTSGPACSVTLDSARTVLVLLKTQILNTSTADDIYMSFVASGATTVAAADGSAVRSNGSGTAEQFASFALVACNAGTTTFTAKYRVDGGNGRFTNRSIAAVVIA